jgi:NitT/TauT family transport system substrate-binding protein
VLFDAALVWRKEHPGRPLYPVNVVVARQDLIDGRPDDVRRFLAAYDEAIGFINGNPAEANVLIARELKLDPAVVAAARTRIEYGARVDVKAAIQTLAWSHRLGYLKAIPDERALFDLRFLPPVQAEAARR